MNVAIFNGRLATMLVLLSLLSLAAAEEPPKPPSDGVHQTFNEKGKLIAEETYLNGVLNGPSKKWDVRGALVLEGKYKNGKTDGVWTEYRQPESTLEKTYRDGVLHGPYKTRSGRLGNSDGQYADGERDGEWVKWRRDEGAESRTVQHFRRGIRDGKWEYTSSSGKEPVQITFKDGQVVESPGELKDLPLLKRYQQMTGPDKPRDELLEAMIEALFAQTDLEYPETPFYETVQDVVERFGLPICPDMLALQRNKRTLEAPNTLNEQGVPLLLGLARIAKNHGLTLDYHYHAVWLTRQDIAENWKDDPTGAIVLAPAKGSNLEKVLELTLAPHGMPGDGPNPKDLITVLEKDHGVKIEFSAKAPKKTLLDNGRMARILCRGLTIRELLAVTLYQSGCVCSEKNGTLVIVPQTPVQ